MHSATRSARTLSPLASRADSGVGVKFLAPHNSFVQIMAELGFTGLILLLTTVALTFVSIARAERWLRNRQPRASAMAQALTGSLIGLLVGIFFLSHAYSALTYSGLALGLAYGKLARLGREAERSQLRRRT